jgi:hypothetical protein
MTEFIGQALGCLIIFLITFVGTYLAISFIGWDANVANWSEFARGLLAVTSVSITAIAVGNK